MVEEQITRLVKCDICNDAIHDEKVNRIKLRGYNWDLCHICGYNLQQSLTFLTIKVGLSIEYSWNTIDHELLKNGRRKLENDELLAR